MTEKGRQSLAVKKRKVKCGQRQERRRRRRKNKIIDVLDKKQADEKIVSRDTREEQTEDFSLSLGISPGLWRGR